MRSWTDLGECQDVLKRVRADHLDSHNFTLLFINKDLPGISNDVRHTLHLNFEQRLLWFEGHSVQMSMRCERLATDSRTNDFYFI